MIWQIATKEIRSNLMTLRFALIHLLVLVLMIANALTHSLGFHGYRSELQIHQSKLKERQAWLEKHASKGLGALAVAGPGDFHHAPRPLTFAADGQNEILPREISTTHGYRWGMVSFYTGAELSRYDWREIWTMGYPPGKSESILSLPIRLDWSFVGIVLSFGAILLSFDAISGERIRGTLSLMFSNSVSCVQVLLGKFLGTLATLMGPLLMGLFLNLLLIYALGAIPLGRGEWFRLSAMVGLFLVYLSAFIFLGLFVSSRVSHSATSIIVLLFVWVFLAFLFPNLQGVFASNLHPILSAEAFARETSTLERDIELQRRTLCDSLREKGRVPDPANPDLAQTWADQLLEWWERRTHLNDQHVDAQLQQVRFARKVNLASPVATFQYAMESLAGTGVESYASFVGQVRQYRREFIDFIRSQDRGDPVSPHIYGVPEGLSQKPVDPKSVPKFQERLTYGSVLSYVGLLALVGFGLFMAAYVSFLRSDVKR